MASILYHGTTGTSSKFELGQYFGIRVIPSDIEDIECKMNVPDKDKNGKPIPFYQKQKSVGPTGHPKRKRKKR